MFGFLSNGVLILNNAGECEESRAVAQKCLDVRPYSLSAQIMLGMGFMCSEDYEEAIHIREKVVDKWSTSVNDVLLLAIPMQPMECMLKPPSHWRTMNT